MSPWPKGLSRKFGKEEPKAADAAQAPITPPEDVKESVPEAPPVETAAQVDIGAKLPAGMPDSKPDATMSTGTKPWERANQVGAKPWRRDITALTKKDRDNHCRWVNQDAIDARLERGYEIADPSKWGQPADKIINDGSPLGRRIVRRGMVLMSIPLEGKQFYEQENEKIIQSRKADAKEMVKKQAEELLAKAGFAVQVVDKSKVEKDGIRVR